MKMAPLYVHFGAGNIGRALAGPIFRRAGYDVLFVDAAPDIVEALRTRRAYRVVIKDDLPPGVPDVLEVTGVDGVSVDDRVAVREAVARADLIGTAVGAARLPDVMKAMAPGLAARGSRPVSVLLCENQNGAASVARSVLEHGTLGPKSLAGRVGLVESSIGKMVPLMPAEVRKRDPLEVWSEAYNTLIADRDAFVGPLPTCGEGLELKNNFQAYVERKLYIHNLGHATCAYYGFIQGYRLIAEAIRDRQVMNETRAVMMAAATALARRYPSEFTLAGLAGHVEDLLRRFGNRALGDTVFRVGRDLPRKLAPGDRFMGALRLIQEEGGDTRPLFRALRTALLFRAVDEEGILFPPDLALLKRITREGLRATVRACCGMSEAELTQLLDSRE